MTDAYYENERFEKLSFFGENFNDCKFIDCDFIGCTFESCKLTECYFWECRFDGCSVTDMDFENCETKFLQLKNSVFVGVNWALLQPTGTIGSTIDAISSCRLKYNTFAQMSLKRFDFPAARLPAQHSPNAIFPKAGFRTVTFRTPNSTNAICERPTFAAQTDTASMC